MAYRIQEKVQDGRNLFAAIAEMLELWDGGLGRHCRRTGIYVEMLTEKMLQKRMYADILTSEYAEYLLKGVCLHDIGGLVRSSVGLTGVSWENENTEKYREKGLLLLQKNIGYLSNRSLAAVIWEMSAFQYEKWDGSGKPRGMKGEEIPLSARILSIADTFDVLMHSVEADTPEIVLKKMEKESGKSFDPWILDTFLSLLHNERTEEIVGWLP